MPAALTSEQVRFGRRSYACTQRTQALELSLEKLLGDVTVVSVEPSLLEILCCPVTKIPVKMLSKERLGDLNKRVANREVKYVDGKLVDEPLDEALITENGTTLYRVDDGIPVMLEEQGIPSSQLHDF